MSNMKTHYCYQDGLPVPDGRCIQTLSSATEFKVIIEALGGGPSPEEVMNFLKKRWGVVEVEAIFKLVTCRGMGRHDSALIAPTPRED